MVILFYFLIFLSLTDYNLFLFWLIVIFTYSKLLMNTKFLLNSMLSLELIVMLTILLMACSTFEMSGSAIMLFITLSVCEAVMGLSIIIFISRFKEIEMMNIN